MRQCPGPLMHIFLLPSRYGSLSLGAGFGLLSDHSLGLANSAAFIAVSFQTFVGDFRPKLFHSPRRRLVCVPFGVIRSPRHLFSLPWLADQRIRSILTLGSGCHRSTRVGAARGDLHIQAAAIAIHAGAHLARDVQRFELADERHCVRQTPTLQPAHKCLWVCGARPRTGMN